MDIMNKYLMFLLMFPSLAQSYTDVDVTWLAKNVYFEARNQGIAGQLSVAHVTLNRVADKRFPNTVKGVVTQGLTRKSWLDGMPVPIKNKCQFSWYCDGKPDVIANWPLFNEIKKLMYTFTANSSIIDITEGATHYHADYVYPDWANTKTKTIEIEDHIFYRWE
jgi:spore germination cell wall hydrolase CwlJ-like protein|tara:strand:+ start:1086 stop:1577 length:492 start_codon:yes stop_codon:yes gene_type:complete